MTLKVPTFRSYKRVTSLLFALSLAACGGSSGRTASVSAGPMPTGGSFTGVWHSPQYGEMHLVQTNTTVIGEYEKDHRKGRLQGGVKGNVLRFYWEEERELVQGRSSKTNGRGYFVYEIGDDKRHYIRGEWGIDHDEIGGGTWNAYRLQNRTPELKQGGASDADKAAPSDQVDEEYDPYEDDNSSGTEPAGGDAFEGVL